ncbi:unnamed protein product [Rotaria sp. Silwood1]|nr:unnamed protein product [Rotaria sp. Silwood1]CAF4614357.1 unnamed protein product [Rotaria sp. Silwood1]CAF4806058.1 unnamed protein product [Rotaria sp. Silwood1]
MHESSFPSEPSCNSDNGIHLFVNSNNGFTLSTDRSQSSHLPDPILRLHIVINILHLWKFEIRRCICIVRVSGTCNFHTLDFDIRNLTDSSLTLVIVDHGSIEFLCHTTTDASIIHIRFVPYDLTRFISIDLDNIRFWRIKNGNDLKSMSISIVRIYKFTI